jgi:DNA-binding CsgD family transcriptional regulator
LLETALGDGAACREAVRSGPQRTTRYNHVLLSYADAIALGREGRAADAGALFAEQPAGYPANRSWMDRHARRIVAACALADGWGEPGVWLRDAIEWFNGNNQPHGAAAARRLLRAAGMAAPRPARPASRVPPDLRAMGVTDREMDVLILVTEGLSNREIAAKLFVSARTVETHVAHLLRRTNSSNRAKLAALGAGAGR